MMQSHRITQRNSIHKNGTQPEGKVNTQVERLYEMHPKWHNHNLVLFRLISNQLDYKPINKSIFTIL
jgi:hypothetical protein